MDFPVDPTMAHKYKAELFLKEYLLADSYVLYAAVLGGILMCKLVLYFAWTLFVKIYEIYDQFSCAIT
jgi:hypothetical protein